MSAETPSRPHPFDAAVAAGRPPFKVADLTQAGLGRKEIRLAEHEMPGLMALREQYGAEKPLAGAQVPQRATELSVKRGVHVDKRGLKNGSPDSMTTLCRLTKRAVSSG